MPKSHREDLIQYLEFYSDLGVEDLLVPATNRMTKPDTTGRKQHRTGRPPIPDPAVEGDLFSTKTTTDPDLPAVREDLGDCCRCKLHATRKTIVFGDGNPNAKVMFIGEAPGADEDAQGLPFVGRAGQLLTKIIKSVGFTREEVYITNILKCRPPKNRNPESDEIVACQEFLFRQISTIQPLIICTLGTFAVQTLMQVKTPISKLRGQLMEYRGTKLIATFHPAYLLRNPAEKRKVWEDIKMLRAYYNEQCGPVGSDP